MQRVPVWKIVFIVVILLFSLWMLMPTMRFYSYDAGARHSGEPPELEEVEQLYAEDQIEAEEYNSRKQEILEDFRRLKESSIRLGLDLQGGVHQVIEVDLDQVEEQLREDNPDIDASEVENQANLALGSAATIIETRVDQYGLSEASVIRQPPDRLILEMPGFSDPGRVAELVNATAELSFHLLPSQNEMAQILGDIDAVAEEDFLSLIDDRPTGIAAVAVETPDNYTLVDDILKREEVQAAIPHGLMFRWSGEKERDRYYDYPHRLLYLLYEKEELTGAHLANAYPYFDQMTNRPEVSLQFDNTGARIFARVTGDNVGNPLAIVMDERVFSAPTIQGEISGGNARVTGLDDFDEAQQLAVVLRAGALPVPLSIEESRVVGPSLGRDSIESGIMAGVLGGIVVLVYMVVYYSFTGLIADVAVLLNLFLLMAGMAMFKATLTLPGIAGIVLTIGMAVDANVLIFERLREEMRGKSKTIQLVLEKGYGRAFMTIFDANITTLITALVLFQFGTGPIKGFAVTLSLGIIVSMFTAIFVSRTILEVMVARGMKHLNTGQLSFFRDTHFDFFKNPKGFMSTTAAIGLIGFMFLVVQWDDYKGIDFAGGTEIVVQFEEYVHPQEVRNQLQQAGLRETIIQEVLQAENEILIRVREGVVDTGLELTEIVEGALPERSFETIGSGSVGAKVGSELLLKAINCILFSSIGILLYITARFEFRFAVAAVATLFHDIFFTLAMLAFAGTEFNLPIVAALLTVLGYSLNDTIVVFDRIRENYTSSLLNFRDVVNTSINQTLSRTVNTSMTTFFVVTILFFVGGPVIHDFAFTLIIGVLIGTYSSIFVSSPLLLFMGRQGPRKVVAET